MVWIDSLELSSPLATSEEVLEIIDMRYTSFIAILTPKSIIIVHESTLLPLAIHTRTQESIEQHGSNKRVKTKNLNLGVKMSRLNIFNLFLVTSQDYLLIYQVHIDPTKSVFEVSDNDNITLQKLLPVNSNSERFSFTKMLNSVTRSLGSNHINLQNLESFNIPVDELANFSIEYVRLSVFKTIKIGIGISKFWLKSNSHNLFVYRDNLIQVINIKTLNNEICNFIEFSWFDSQTKDIWYNYSFNYFIIADISNELWFMNVGENELNPEGHKLGLNLEINDLKFNPVYEVVLIKYRTRDGDTRLGLFRLDGCLRKATDIQISDWTDFRFQWSNDGEFFIVLDNKGRWFISSKFGNITTDTEILSNEINENYLSATQLLISSNDNSVLLIKDDQIHKVNLVRLLSQQDLIITSPHYFSLVESNKLRNKLLKYPLLSHFKYSGLASSSKAKLKVSKNYVNQFIISCGDKLSVSNRYKNAEGDYNHLIWFNFKNYFVETLNITNHVSFKQFLILINRATKDYGGKDKLVDELVIINLKDSGFAQGGSPFPFDSDLFIWRHALETILTFELVDNKLIILDSQYKLFIFELFDGYTNASGNYYDFYMKQSKTIDFTNMKDKLALSKITKIQMIDNLNFLILLNNGEFYILKNQSNKILLTSYFQLIQVQSCIEEFRINDITINEEMIKYIYLFKGNQLLIYNLTHLIDLIFEPVDLNPHDGLDEEEVTSQMKLIKPITIELENFQPLKIHKTLDSINLIGLQDLILNDSFIRVKLNTKLILNNLVEFDLLNATEVRMIHTKFSSFSQYTYCLELLLFDYLTKENPLIHSLLDLIKLADNYESIFINCLRKIEFKYWSNFFRILKTDPFNLMNKLLDSNNVQLGYNFLIIYLNLKSEEETENSSGYLDSNDEKIILSLIERLVNMCYWDWCFELCRFIKLLDPSSRLLIRIRDTVGNKSSHAAQLESSRKF
ncbi:hypothetical protein CANTEDRAFT_109461 [Yamadazyma tenuis ATCC 10573]|uniref:RIC1 C-terminal alpha solenoid region domain-containing protein n=1 Tax=Candida tenuis (strain ATCC 10573 / BCRC 21748 / CBS 615 / JCM 9827 / NBRC 10315 / NRRL Y-1498 / VKM Y-70) TaxID=590646 RepID=G3B7H9_CANTC|nr:uncharacterized protein CANTEDRAFT_109461 [Yamadazyma tenuis ATCC 10573]EGV62283.1 hypothetical protein CANTEDRAFT_109461 [Yamadazyma tenuis ATCC 10573]